MSLAPPSRAVATGLGGVNCRMGPVDQGSAGPIHHLTTFPPSGSMDEVGAGSLCAGWVLGVQFSSAWCSLCPPPPLLSPGPQFCSPPAMLCVYVCVGDAVEL